jgi:hypothetical protein
MASRLVEIGTAIAVLVSAVVLGAMLAAPLLDRPAGTALAEPTATPEPSAESAAPPLGLYLLRGPYTAGAGPCLGIELTPDSYPASESGAVGRASVLWWSRGMTGCDSRTDEIEEVAATVDRQAREGAPDETLGYAIGFTLPVRAGLTSHVELTILAERSTQELLQVVDTGGGGAQGMVFDLVGVIDPPLDPRATPSPAAALQPIGLYLLRGPLDSAGHCLVIELDEASYPPDTDGRAGIRWWQRGDDDPDSPAPCLTRSGDVHDATASVTQLIDGLTGDRIGYAIGFELVDPAKVGVTTIEIVVDVPRSSEDMLLATLTSEVGGPSIGFDRVDAIDPPLAPSP